MWSKIPLILDFDEGDGSAEILIEAKFAGRPYICLLDTGAAQSAIVWDDFSSSLVVESETLVHGAMGSTAVATVSLSSFQLGPIERENVVIARLPADHACPRNIVGMDMLADWTVILDLKSKSLSLGDERPNHGSALILGDRGHPYVSLSLAGEDYEAVLDTGAGLTCVDSSIISKHPDCFEARGDSLGTDASGCTMRTPLYQMSNFTCGGLTFAPHTVVGLDLQKIKTKRKFLIVLGYSTLSRARWTLAFKHKLWSLE